MSATAMPGPAFSLFSCLSASLFCQPSLLPLPSCSTPMLGQTLSLFFLHTETFLVKKQVSLKKCTSPFSILNFYHFSTLKSHVSFLCQISPFCCVRIACLFSMSNLSVSITYLSSYTTSASCHKYLHVYRGLPWA